MTYIIIAALLFVLWYVFSGSYKVKMQDPATLRPNEIEDSIIELKKKILVTSAYKAEAEYQRLYSRLNVLMGQVLERHKHFVLHVEAKGVPSYGFFISRTHHDENGVRYNTYALPSDLDPTRFDPNLLIYACFFIWHGGQAKDVGSIEADPKLMLRIVEYLINEKSFGPAIFMKGMIKKYGLKIYSQCYPSEARQLFEKASLAGVGSATIELTNLGKFTSLEGMESIQLGA